MEVRDKLKSEFIQLFELNDFQIKFLMDSNAKLYWRDENGVTNELALLPWDYQLPFYLKFLHNDSLAERFKNFSVLGAIDVYIKSMFYENSALEI